MPTDKSLYPENWDHIAARVKAEADYICQRCGRQCYRPGQPCGNRARVMSVHHVDHNPANSHPDNLIALCAPCHLQLDAAHHARNALATRTRNRGQLWLHGFKHVH